ncbi:FMN-dependent NADH-azoreductase [Albidovulum inexpectatum]|uniref:FMN dependent NADH:quinone oxidoreductase n=1 Tax=Albidovulum inexpectatum TaxID=196587 RepID=A0A2S5JG87_9RHOB|nr:NAD(P)H-dependent oxidoreductase [Albidovulum inexpectatum]PPB80440.1 FMN-dependent NADH-azoreductase [Albidovulum inexpectatum]
MTHILRIDSSIKGADSVSRRLTGRIVERLKAAHPDAIVTERDVTNGIPAIDGAWLGAVYIPADQRNAEQAQIAAFSDRLLEEVRAADILVIGLPVYNFGVPAQLKNWIDQITRRGESFVYTENGPEGLLKGKRAIVALSSDGTRMGSEVDFASPYLRHMLGFLGITDVTFVAADQMVFDPEATLKRAEQEVERIAA